MNDFKGRILDKKGGDNDQFIPKAIELSFSLLLIFKVRF
jgi:hypothetical protein